MRPASRRRRGWSRTRPAPRAEAVGERLPPSDAARGSRPGSRSRVPARRRRRGRVRPRARPSRAGRARDGERGGGVERDQGASRLHERRSAATLASEPAHVLRAASRPAAWPSSGSVRRSGRAARSRQSARAGRPRGCRRREASGSRPGLLLEDVAGPALVHRRHPRLVEAHPRPAQQASADGAAVDAVGDEAELRCQAARGAAARSRGRAACPPGSGARRREGARRPAHGDARLQQASGRDEPGRARGRTRGTGRGPSTRPGSAAASVTGSRSAERRREATASTPRRAAAAACGR